MERNIVNCKDYQLTKNGSFQIKRFPGYYEYQPNEITFKLIKFRLNTIIINKMYFVTILN